MKLLFFSVDISDYSYFSMSFLQPIAYIASIIALPYFSQFTQLLQSVLLIDYPFSRVKLQKKYGPWASFLFHLENQDTLCIIRQVNNNLDINFWSFFLCSALKALHCLVTVKKKSCLFWACFYVIWQYRNTAKIGAAGFLMVIKQLPGFQYSLLLSFYFDFINFYLDLLIFD